MLKIHSHCLPYFLEDEVDIFLLDGLEIRVPISKFQDVTSDGGRFYQFYTFLIGGAEDVQPKNKRGPDPKDLPNSENRKGQNDHAG
jgi:hypothetical protein